MRVSGAEKRREEGARRGEGGRWGLLLLFFLRDGVRRVLQGGKKEGTYVFRGVGSYAD